MDDRLRLDLSNRIEDLTDCCRRVSLWLEERGASPRTLYRAELLLEELVTNVIRYAHDDESAHRIEVEAESDGAGIRLRVADNGRPFDPVAAPQPEPPGSLEEAPIGGLGLKLVHRMSDALSYRRVDGWNRTEVFLRQDIPPP